MLLQAQRKLREAKHVEVFSLLSEVCILLPHGDVNIVPDARFISQKLDLCQVTHDMHTCTNKWIQAHTLRRIHMYRHKEPSMRAVPSVHAHTLNLSRFGVFGVLK